MSPSFFLPESEPALAISAVEEKQQAALFLLFPSPVFALPSTYVHAKRCSSEEGEERL